MDDDTWTGEKCWRKVDDDSTRDASRASLKRASERENDTARKAKGPTTGKTKPSLGEAAAKDDLFAPREFGLTKIS